jgi:hypothetical protein
LAAIADAKLILIDPEAVARILLEDKGRTMSWLRERVSSLDNEQAWRLAYHLATCLGPDAYTALLANALRGASPTTPAVHCFVGRFAGSKAYRQIVQADANVPEELREGRSIPLELASAGLQNDDAASSRWLVEQAGQSPSMLFYLWNAAALAGHAAAAEELSTGLAALRLFPTDSDEPRKWRVIEFQTRAIACWIHHPSRNPSLLEWFLAAVRAARATEPPFFDLAGPFACDCAPAELASRILLDSIDDDRPLRGAHQALRAGLAAGSLAGWQHFFRWAKACPENWSEARELLRAGTLPEAPGNEWWEQFLVLFSSIHEAELACIAAFEVNTNISPDALNRPQAMARYDATLTACLSEQELLEQILSRPPCAATGRHLTVLLSQAPILFQESRLAAFASYVAPFRQQDLPSREVLLRLDDAAVQGFLLLTGEPGRAQLRDIVCEELRPEGSHPMSGSGALYYLRRPWLAQLLDADLERVLKAALKNEPRYLLIQAEDLRERWVPQSFVLERFARPSEAWIPPHIEFPDWLSEGLLRQAGELRDEEVLGRLAKRFTRDERRRARLIASLQEHLSARVEPWIVDLLAQLLTSKSNWTTHGPSIVRILLEQGQAPFLKDLIWSPELKRAPELLPSIHTGFALGILQLVERHVLALSADGTQRALTAIALLDPSPHFTRDLHDFMKTTKLDDQALSIAQHIDSLAKAKGGADADLDGVDQCIAELKALPLPFASAEPLAAP